MGAGTKFTDALGREALEVPFQQDNPTLDISALSPGVYTVQFTATSGR